MISSSTAQSIDAYAQWTHDIWRDAAGETNPQKNLVVMGLGLVGECGEVLAELEPEAAGGAIDRAALVNEMGDAAYYWARLVMNFGLTASTLWPKHSLLRPIAPSLLSICLGLSARSGAVAEALKKEVRDGHLNMDKLTAGLVGVAEFWVHLARHYGLKVEDILDASRRKVEERYGASRA